MNTRLRTLKRHFEQVVEQVVGKRERRAFGRVSAYAERQCEASVLSCLRPFVLLKKMKINIWFAS